MQAYFCDSCLFFAFAYPFENWHEASVAFFNKSDVHRYTGERVKEEIEKRLRKRQLLYTELIRHIARGQNPEQFTSTSLNLNDLRHFQAILKEISGQTQENVLTYIRDKSEITQKGIQHAMRQISQPFAQRINEDMCTDILVAIITNRADAEILVDALYFSEGRSITFVTLDSTDITQKRNQIIKAIKNYRSLENSEFLSLGIQHIGEIK